MAGKKRVECTGPECVRSAVTKGYCSAHYQQARRLKAKGLFAWKGGRRVGLVPLPPGATPAERFNLVIRVSLAQHARWRRAAKRAGTNLSEWVRATLDALDRADRRNLSPDGLRGGGK